MRAGRGKVSAAFACLVAFVPLAACTAPEEFTMSELRTAIVAGPCDAALAQWRRHAASDDPSDRRSTRLSAVWAAQNGWGCIPAGDDRKTALDAVMVAAIYPSLEGSRARYMLREGLGPDWIERIAKSGDVAYMLRAADLHVLCSDPELEHPVFGLADDMNPQARASVLAGTAAHCEKSGGIESPEFGRGLYWYTVALSRADWPDHAVPTSAARHLSRYVAAIKSGQGSLAVELAAAGRIPENVDALPAVYRAAVEAFLDDFAAGHDAGLIARARADAALFEPEPVDWSAMLE